MKAFLAIALTAVSATAAPLPFIAPTGAPAPEAVFHRSQRVLCTRPGWTVTDAYGRTIAGGKPGAPLPTNRYGAFRMRSGAGSVSYAVIPDMPRAGGPGDPFGMGGYSTMRYSAAGQRLAAALLKRMGAAASRDERRWNLYCPPGSPDEAEMDRQMRETVKWYAARGIRKDLWVSEVGWNTTSDREQEARQAQYLVRAYAMALDAGMNRVFWCSFQNDGAEGPGGQIPWPGVVNRDMTPKISYAAYAAMVARLRGLKPAGSANMGAAVKAILFAGRSSSTAVVWADKQRGSSAPIQGCRLYDLMGNPETGRIPLSDWPVYILAPGKPATWLRSRLQSAPLAGIPPVEVRPLQLVQRGGAEAVLVNVRNQSAASARITLTTSAGSAHVPLAPGERTRVEVPHRREDTGFWYSVEAGGKRLVVRPGLKGVPSTLIPMGDREAPILDQLWALKPEWVMDTADHNVGILPWSPKDFRAKAQFLYDENGLWMRFIVTDKVFHQTRTGNDIWREDSVQVSIQSNASKTASAKRHSFGFALTPDGPRAFRYSGPGGWTGTVDVVQNGKQTTYDVRVPWSDLAPLQGHAGERFLMDFMVNDNDGYGRRGWLEWTSGIGTGDDPSKWMEWTLDKPGPPATRM